MANRSDVAERAPERTDRGRNPSPWVVSATDLTFLWDDCPRCFYGKVVQRQARPRGPFPGVFGAIDRAMKAGLLGRRAEQLAPGAPAGVIGSPDHWVKSLPVTVPGYSGSFVLQGRLDCLVACDDGGYGVVDLKTALPGDAQVPLYGHQVHAYSWALERPATGSPAEVRFLGLLCFAPEGFGVKARSATLHGDLQWVGIPRDDVAFEWFLGEVLRTLGSPEPPAPSPGCRWCLWRRDERVAA